MSQSLIDTIESGTSAVLEPLTVEQYHTMLATGVLREGEPVELIDGLLIRKDRRVGGGSITTVGPRHTYVVECAKVLLDRACEALPVHTRVQRPLTLEPRHEPEPDLALVRGTIRDYADRHPEGKDVELLIEAADSSLEFDRGRKTEVYAAAGVPCYLLVNLRDNVVEVRRDPTGEPPGYRDLSTAHPGETVELAVCGETVPVPVSELFGV